MIASSFDLTYLYLCAFILLLFILSEVVVLFAAYFRLDQMEDHFIASQLVSINSRALGNGPLGRMRRVRQIGALNGRFTHFQMLDRQAVMEAEIFPEHLKKWVRIPACLFRFVLTGVGLLLLWMGFEQLCETLSRPASDLKLLCIAILIACLVLGFIALLAKIFISIFKLAELESLLEGSYFVARNRRIMGNGVYGRYCRLSHITTMLLLDVDFLSFTDPQAMDGIARFPTSLRRLVIIPTRMLAYSFLGYCVIHLGGRAFGLLA